MFELQTFPARDGDCLIVSWGSSQTPKRMMIDGGRASCWPLVKEAVLSLPEAERDFELLVVTHIDADHIEGVLKMLNDPDCPIRFKEVWFNAYHHLRASMDHEDFGPSQGDELSTRLRDTPHLWNRSFNHEAVVVTDPTSPPHINIAGLELTLISPTLEKLARLKPVWQKWIDKEKLKSDAKSAADPLKVAEYLPGFETFGSLPDVTALSAEPLPQDVEPPNGSSIAFIARFEGRSILLAGDAHADVSEIALASLPVGDRMLDLVKLSHHGSKANLSAGLVAIWTCCRFLISTDGSRHNHPDAQTIAYLLAACPGRKTFYFNYRHESAALWDNDSLKQQHNYEAVYPVKEGKLTIDIAALPPVTRSANS